MKFFITIIASILIIMSGFVQVSTPPSEELPTETIQTEIQQPITEPPHEHTWSTYSYSNKSFIRSCTVCLAQETENITELTPFNYISPKAQSIIEELLAQKPTQWARYLGVYTLDNKEPQEIQLCLHGYFGNMTKINDMLYFSFNGNNSYSILYDGALLQELQAEQIIFDQNLNKILTELTFKNLKQETIISTVFLYLINNFSYTANIGNAAAGLEARKGNCNVYAILFQALCGKLGVKMQTCVGFDYKNAYHIWNYDGQFYYDLTYYESTKSSKYFAAPSLKHKCLATNRYLTAQEMSDYLS